MGKKANDAADVGSESNDAHASEEEHAQRALDEALRESFPASDPIAVSIDRSVAAPEVNIVKR